MSKKLISTCLLALFSLGSLAFATNDEDAKNTQKICQAKKKHQLEKHGLPPELQEELKKPIYHINNGLPTKKEMKDLLEKVLKLREQKKVKRADKKVEPNENVKNQTTQVNALEKTEDENKVDKELANL